MRNVGKSNSQHITIGDIFEDSDPISVFSDMSVRKSGQIHAGIYLQQIRIKSNRVEFDYIINAGTSSLHGTLTSHLQDDSTMTTKIKELCLLAEDRFNQIRKVR